MSKGNAVSSRRETDSGRLRIFLVDDHQTLRDGLTVLLETDPTLCVVGSASNVEEALPKIESLNPSVVVTDINLPEKSGIDLILALRARAHTVPIVVLTSDRSPSRLRDAMRAGANGYVLKDASHAELLQALSTVCTGRKFLCDSLSRSVLAIHTELPVSNEEYAPVHIITKREREVLILIALGQSNKHSARDLGLSVKTVEKHRSNLMRKLHLHNTAAVTMFALRHGFVKRGDAQIA